MSNMSYCRFENTLRDLRDCYENMDDECSKLEDEFRSKLIMLCKRIADGYIDEDTGKPTPLEHRLN